MDQTRKRNAKVRDEINSTKVTFPSDRQIVITRSFNAPSTVVFDAWTKPEHVAHWWDPSREPLEVCEIDLRPNGVFRFVPRGPGLKHPFMGTYREISPPTRLVFTTQMSPLGAESVGTLIFLEHDGRTTLTMTIECASRDDRDALLRMRIDVGTARTLDNLDEYLNPMDVSMKQLFD